MDGFAILLDTYCKPNIDYMKEGWRNGQWQKQWVFQQDGTPSHRAEETRDLVRDIFPERIEVDISLKRNNGEWPPNSTDLCVEDFSLLHILENEACSKPHQSIEALKRSLVKAWNAILQEVIDRAVGDFPKRLKKCIDAQGGHFENT
uniref:Transposase n=1 Tax=Acrobeloides nanus TaxID=290746 RepID=A0A914E219_9BILA